MSTDEKFCAICLDPMQPVEAIHTTACHHTFHYECARNWCLQNPSCAICREQDIHFESPESDDDDDEFLVVHTTQAGAELLNAIIAAGENAGELAEDLRRVLGTAFLERVVIIGDENVLSNE